MLKIVKEKNKLVKFLNEKLKISVGLERFFFFVLLFLTLCHIVSCLWYGNYSSKTHAIIRVFTARLEEFTPETWIVRYGYQDYETWEVTWRRSNWNSSTWYPFTSR